MNKYSEVVRETHFNLSKVVGKGAEPVYALYGLNGIGCEEMPPVDTPYMNGSIAYHNRKGPHAILPYDWEQFLRFADKYFKNK